MAGREVLLAADSPEASLLAVCGSHGGPAQSELASQLCAVYKETKINKVLVKKPFRCHVTTKDEP